MIYKRILNAGNTAKNKQDRKDLWVDLLKGLLFLGCISYLFYHSVWAMIPLSPILIVYRRLQNKEREIIKRQKLGLQFKDAVLAVSASLNAGYSIENAFCEAHKDLCQIYEKEEVIVKEFLLLKRQLKNNFVLEKLLLDFGERSQVEEIKDFAEVFSVAKRSGGDLNKIIQRTVLIISEKLEVKREIQTMLASKKLEQKIMNLVPMLILFYISITSPGFFHSLYGNIAGIMIMTICLFLYGFAYFLGKKIIDIEV